MTKATSGYSAKQLSDKLGIKPGMRLALLHPPRELPSLLSPLPDRVSVVGARARAVGCVLLFVTAASDLRKELPGALSRLAPGGMCWICWPKKTSGAPTDLTEDRIRDIGLPTGWVDVKVCAVSETWSGLKFLRRKKS